MGKSETSAVAEQVNMSLSHPAVGALKSKRLGPSEFTSFPCEWVFGEKDTKAEHWWDILTNCPE